MRAKIAMCNLCGVFTEEGEEIKKGQGTFIKGIIVHGDDKGMVEPHMSDVHICAGCIDIVKNKDIQ